MRCVLDGTVDGRFEGAVQRGRRTGRPVSAYLIAAWVGRGFAAGRAHLTLWYDYLSGDDTPGNGRTEVFSTLYGTNHRQYGFADQFTNIPANTAGHGLQDRAVKLSLKPSSRVAVEADAHSFAAARKGTLGSAHYGDEVDLTLTHRATTSLSFMGGLSRVFQDRAMAEIGRLDRDMTWAFIMVNAIF
jgi:Alginate export